MLSNEEIADILADSREYIEEHGWCRSRLVAEDGKVCAFGAVGMSQNWIAQEEASLDWRTECMNELTQVIKVLEKIVDTHSSGIALTSWNDRVAKDQQEVLDTFAKAEKIARFGSDPDA